MTAISQPLDAEVQRLSLSCIASLNRTGNELANPLNGNAGANTPDGREGDEALYGGAGNDILIGDTGTSPLDGSADADILTGGTVSDVSRFVQGQAKGDVVMDFGANEPPQENNWSSQAMLLRRARLVSRSAR